MTRTGMKLALAGVMFFSLFVALETVRAAGSRGTFNIKGEALLHYQQAMALTKKGDLDRAIDHYMRAYKVNPDVLAQDDGGLLDKAVRHLSTTSGDGAQGVHRTFQLCEVYALKGFELESMACYEKVVSRGKGSPFGKLAREKLHRLRTVRKAHEAAMAKRKAEDAARAAKQAANAAKQAEMMKNPAVQEKIKRLVEDSKKGQENTVKALKGHIVTLSKRVESLVKANMELEQKFALYRKRAETWRNYKNLFFSNPQNVRDLQNNRFNRAVFPSPSAFGAQAPRPNTSSR